MVHKVRGNIAHHLQAEFGRKDAGVLSLVFFQDVRLHGAAHVGQHPFTNFGSLGISGLPAVVSLEFFQILVNGRVHEHGQDAGCRAVDRHRHTGTRAAQIKPGVQHLHVVQRGNAHARVADLAINVGPRIGVIAVQRDGVKRGGQALGIHAGTQQLESRVGAKGVALTRKHAGRVFVFTLERERARGIGIAAGHVVQHQPLQDFAMIFILR